VQRRKYRISEEDSEAPGGGHTVTALSHNRVKGEKWYLATGISVAARSSLVSRPGPRQPGIDTAAAPDFDLARAHAGFSRAGVGFLR
jgi:hypothetical protein